MTAEWSESGDIRAEIEHAKKLLREQIGPNATPEIYLTERQIRYAIEIGYEFPTDVRIIVSPTTLHNLKADGLI